MPTSGSETIRLSVVIPVYQGERTLDPLLAELKSAARGTTPGGRPFELIEVILVHDAGPDRSDEVIERLAAENPFVKPIWLSRNFGQHPATLAGMASSAGDWVATLDEDGQHDPADLPKMLDRALDSGAPLIYARPTNPAPHGAIRNLLTAVAKFSSGAIVGDRFLGRFHSFRLIRGDIARSLAAYCGHGVFLDVALSWVVSHAESCPVAMRSERGRASGYSLRSLVAHFWRLILTAGTRPLRIISITGTLSILAAIGFSALAVYRKTRHEIPVPGWTSTMIAVCFFSGLILFSLGVIAEYLGVTLTMAMGKPLYLIVPRPARRRSPGP
jgi:undecaprenyl-phosphate 4-deoxy-4-formamido-L-arabinose transferase